MKNNQRRAFLYERHNGKDVKRAITQIRNHVLLLIEGGASLTLNIPIAVSVLFEFEDEACLKRVIGKLKSEPDFEAFRDYIIFRSPHARFHEGWQKVGE